MCTLPAEGGIKVADGVRAAYQLTRLSPSVQGAQLTVSSQWGHGDTRDMQQRLSLRKTHPPLPGGSDGKESVCNTGELNTGSIGGWEDPLEKEMATHSSILAWRIPMDRGAWRAAVHRIAKSQTRPSN